MEQITDNKTLTTQPILQCQELQRYSPDTIAEMQKFMQKYPDKLILVKSFAPSMWQEALKNEKEWQLKPTVSLEWIDKAYNAPKLAQSIILAHITMLYRLSGSRDPLDEAIAEQVAGMFYARYSHKDIRCVVSYFAEYPFIKKTLAAFDLQDILKQFVDFYVHYDTSCRNNRQRERERRLSEQLAKEGYVWSINSWREHIKEDIANGKIIAEMTADDNYPILRDIMHGEQSDFATREEILKWVEELAPKPY